jgi:hypothetical protein
MTQVTGIRREMVDNLTGIKHAGPLLVLSAKLLPFKWHEYTEFDKLSAQACSQSQMERIRGRLALTEFEKKHGKSKCAALYDYICARDVAKRLGL